MKYLFFSFGILSAGAYGMNSLDEVYIEMVRDKIDEDIVATVADDGNLKLVGNDYTNFDFTEKKKIEMTAKDPCLIIALYGYGCEVLELASSSSENPWSLKFSLNKPEKYTSAQVELTSISGNIKAALYQPTMGGGEGFVLAIGKGVDSDISVGKVQKSQQLGEIQRYFLLGTMSGIHE